VLRHVERVCCDGCTPKTQFTLGDRSEVKASSKTALGIRWPTVLTDEFLAAYVWLYRQGLVTGTDPAGTRWPISTHLTDEGVLCVDLYEGQVDLYQAQKADPAPIQRSGPMPSHLVVNVGGVKVGGPSRIPGRYRWQQSR